MTNYTTKAGLVRYLNLCYGERYVDVILDDTFDGHGVLVVDYAGIGDYNEAWQVRELYTDHDEYQDAITISDASSFKVVKVFSDFVESLQEEHDSLLSHVGTELQQELEIDLQGQEYEERLQKEQEEWWDMQE